MKWRVLELSTNSAAMNMAIDESISESITAGDSQPTIRFYRWLPSAVSIGRFQSMNKEVNVSRCRELGVDCVRRITGGGAVYHDTDGEVTYSVIAPEELFPKGIRESYAYICAWVVNGLRNIGLDAKFVPINDIIIDGKKISGNAQTRKERVLLQHGTILYNLDVKKMFKLLNVSKEKISDKMIKNVEDRVTCISRYKEIGLDGLYKTMLDSFTDGKEWEFGKMSEDETERAEELSTSVYGSEAWNFSR